MWDTLAFYAPADIISQVAQQIFKRFETYSLLAHAALLHGPPLAAYALLFPTGRRILTDLLLTYATYLGALSVFTLLYRISPFHPLAHYPGPFGSKLSQWYGACISWGGYEHLYIASLHERYGDVVRTGTPELEA